MRLRRGDDYTIVDTSGPHLTYQPERLSMESTDSNFGPLDRIGQLTMRNLDIADSRQKFGVYREALGVLGRERATRPDRTGRRPSPRSSSRHRPRVAVMSYTHRIRVRYGECDMQSVVFNANYLAYVDDAIDSWFRTALGDFESLGFDFMVKKISIEWQTPARFADEIDLVARVSRWGNTSFDIEVAATVGERPVLTATVVYVSTTPGAQTGARAPVGPRRARGGPPPRDVATGCRAASTAATAGSSPPNCCTRLLVVGPCRGRIVEVEAYAGGEDPASHAYRG